MDHLDVVARAAVPDPVAAGDVAVRADLGRDRLHQVFDQRPRLRVAPRHQARAFPRALFAPRDAGSDKADPLLRQELGPPFGVEELRVPPVDDHVARLKEGEELRDDRVDRGVFGIERHLVGGNRVFRLDHEHDDPRRFQLRDQLFQRMRAGDLIPLRLDLVEGEKIVDLTGRSVEDRHVVAVVDHVEYQVLAHHGQPHQPDVILLFHNALSI